MRKATNICDYFVIMSCESERKTQGISGVIKEELDRVGIKPHSIGGRGEANWIVLDYLDVIVHVFYQPRREFYNLERLWQDAPRVKITRPKKKTRPRRKTKKSSTTSKRKLKKPHG